MLCASVVALDRPWCTIINVDAPGCGTSVVRGQRAQVGRFSSWGSIVPKGFLAESAYISLCINHSAAS